MGDRKDDVLRSTNVWWEPILMKICNKLLIVGLLLLTSCSGRYVFSMNGALILRGDTQEGEIEMLTDDGWQKLEVVRRKLLGPVQ